MDLKSKYESLGKWSLAHSLFLGIKLIFLSVVHK